MNILLLVLSILSFRWNGPAYAQGTIVFNNTGANAGKISVANLVDGQLVRPRALDEDLNFQLLIYPIKPTLPGSPLLDRSWLLSDGTAKGINVGPGLFADPSHSVFVLPEVAPGTGITVLINMWEGNYPTAQAAVNGGAGTANTVFAMLAGSIEAPPATLVGMPDLGMTLKGVPEPGVLSVLIIGVTLFVFERILQGQSETPLEHAATKSPDTTHESAEGCFASSFSVFTDWPHGSRTGHHRVQ